MLLLCCLLSQLAAYHASSSTGSSSSSFPPPLSADIAASLVAMITIDQTPHFLELPSISTEQELLSAAQSFCTSKLPADTATKCTNQLVTLLQSQQEARRPLEACDTDDSRPFLTSSSLHRTSLTTPHLNLSDHVLIVDNVFQDPHAVRKFALSQPFDQDQTKSKSALNPSQQFRRTKSFNSDPSFVPLRHMIETLLGKSTINWEFPSSQNVNFQLAYDDPGEYDSHCVHVDGSSFGGILYLSPTPPLSTSTSKHPSGTTFFRHKPSGATKVDGSIGTRMLNWEDDKYNMDRWESVQVVDNVFNRLVLFDAKKFHRSSGYFGHTHETGRLFMNFFFELDPRTALQSPVALPSPPLSPSSSSSSSLPPPPSPPLPPSPLVRSNSLDSLSTSSIIVAEQYERLPYPYDGHRLLDSVIGCSMKELNYFLFGGRRKFSETGLNILVAGGGTGGGSVVFALALMEHGIPGVVVHLDLSANSIRLARETATAHGALERIRYVQGSLLDVNQDVAVMQHAPNGFDLIVSTGVLHHLESPSDGLRSLGRALAPGGGMFVMVYGLYGRTGVYPMQEALRLLAPRKGGLDHQDRVNLARRIVAAIPDNHPIHTGLNGGYDLHVDNDDAPFYDLLMHSQDVAFTVDSFLRMADQAGNVEVLDFVHSAKYEPSQRLRPAAGLEHSSLASLERFQRYAVGECLSGRIQKHFVYLTHTSNVKSVKNHTSLEDIHVGLRLDELQRLDKLSQGRKYGSETLLTQFWFSSEGKTAKVCPTGKTTTWKLLSDALRKTLMSKILSTKVCTGWSAEWRIDGNEDDSYYFKISPLLAEIAVASSECKRTVAEIYETVKSKVRSETKGTVDVTRHIFASQLTDYIEWGESLLSVVVEFDSDVPRWNIPGENSDIHMEEMGSKKEKRKRSTNKRRSSEKAKNLTPPAHTIETELKLETETETETAPVTGRMLSASPRIVQYPHLLTTQETEYLRQCAQQGMTTSPHGNAIYTGKTQVAPHRTSTAGFLTARHEASVLGRSIMKKLFSASGSHPSTHAEVLQIQQYQVGGKYSCHFDPFWDQSKQSMAEPSMIPGGQRVKTLISYLYDTPVGGETVFPYALKLINSGRSSSASVPRLHRPDFMEIGIDDVCAEGYEKDNTILMQRPDQGTSLLFQHYLPNGRTLDIRSWHCSCPVRSSEIDVDDIKWIAQLWLRGESYVMYRDPNLIAMWSMDELNASGFDSICPSSRACPHTGRLQFEQGYHQQQVKQQIGKYQVKSNGIRKFYAFLPGSTVLASEPHVFATVLETKRLTIVASFQLPVPVPIGAKMALLTIGDGTTARWFVDIQDMDVEHIHSRRIFTLLFSLDFSASTATYTPAIICKIGSIGVAGADLDIRDVPVQSTFDARLHTFDWKRARLVFGHHDLEVPLALTSVMLFDRTLLSSEIMTVLTSSYETMLGWDSSEFTNMYA